MAVDNLPTKIFHSDDFFVFTLNVFIMYLRIMCHNFADSFANSWKYLVSIIWYWKSTNYYKLHIIDDYSFCRKLESVLTRSLSLVNKRINLEKKLMVNNILLGHFQHIIFLWLIMSLLFIQCVIWITITMALVTSLP